MRVSIRTKLLVLSIGLAILPLGIAGRTMIRITQEELKQSANSELTNTAHELETEINDRFENVWLAPLALLQNAIDDPRLTPEAKFSLIRSAIEQIPGIVASQITVEGQPENPVIIYGSFRDTLSAVGADPREVLRLKPEELGAFEAGDPRVGEVKYVEETGDWLVSLVLPLENPLAGQPALLSAQVRLTDLREVIEQHPFTRNGWITLVNAEGERVLGSSREDLSGLPIVQNATDLLRSRSRATVIEPFDRPEGDTRLGGFAFPSWIDWAIIVELSEEDAYRAVDRMRSSLLMWGVIGLLVAFVTGIVGSLRLSRPIIKITRVAERVSKGDLGARVEGVKLRDEIGDLADRMNEMIVGLTERFHLEKFVSGGTVAAVKGSANGINLGGERKNVTVFFSDIRGFTAFSEKVEPEVVVEMLNTYLRHQAYIVNQYDGDVDKYVGDELVAVFLGDDMAENAVRCAVDIQRKTAELRQQYPDWDIGIGIGINLGEVVVGAMGSEDRMDYTMLGDNVNLGARLCSAAGRDQILVSASVETAVSDVPGVQLSPLDPIKVKGKDQPIQIFEVRSVGLEVSPGRDS